MKENLEQWRAEEAAQFRGWDFSHLDGRMLEDEPPWSYTARACELMNCADALLDLGTGGGERLYAMRDHWPARVAATEPHPPNLALAKELLEPQGATVVFGATTLTAPLPFDDASFDMVISRHSAFNSAEVARILKPNGHFLTQQIDGLWMADLIRFMGAEPQWPNATLEFFSKQVTDAGLHITHQQKWSGTATFTDVGAIIYYLHAVPWLVPSFSVATHHNKLEQLQLQLDAGELLRFSIAKYIIEAHK